MNKVESRNIELFGRWVAENYGVEAILELSNDDVFAARMDEYNEHLMQLKDKVASDSTFAKSVYIMARA